MSDQLFPNESDQLFRTKLPAPAMILPRTPSLGRSISFILQRQALRQLDGFGSSLGPQCASLNRFSDLQALGFVA
jgi:hypothetical protein